MDLKGNIKVLIDEYELERNRLIELIKKCIEEEDYKLAHYHNKALRHVGLVRRNLAGIADPNEIRNRWLKGIEDRSIAGNRMELEMEYVDRAYPIKEEFYQDGQKIDGLIFDLKEGHITSFNLILTQADNLELVFKKKKRNLSLLIKANEDKHVMGKKYKRQLKRLDFKKVGKRKMKKHYSLENLISCENIKQDLAVIFYEIYPFGYTKQESIIVK